MEKDKFWVCRNFLGELKATEITLLWESRKSFYEPWMMSNMIREDSIDTEDELQRTN